MGSEFVKRKSSVWAKNSDTKPSMFAPRPFVLNQKPLFPLRPADAPVHYQEDTVSKKELPLEIPPANYITAKMGYPAPQPTVQHQEENSEEKEPEPADNQESKVDLKADASSTPPYYIFPKLNFGASQPAVQRQDVLENEQEEDSQLDLKPDEAIQAKCSDCESEAQQEDESVQTKLTVGEPGDKYEQEADTVAAKVMAMADSATEKVQRHEIEEKGEGTFQQKPLADFIPPMVQLQTSEMPQQKGAANQGIENQLATTQGVGSPLSDEVRGFMEPRFGTDFSEVRVHTGSAAVQMNHELGAQAFTHGRDIYYGKGKAPGNDALTAHELTHVVQQRKISNSLLPASIFNQKIQRKRKCTGGQWKFDHDGCSMPQELLPVLSFLGISKDNPAGGRDTQFGLSKAGGAACDKHDECYQTCGSIQSQCDWEMFKNMSKTCSSSSENMEIKDKCFQWAEAYYLALVAGGFKAHNERQMQSCSCEAKQKSVKEKIRIIESFLDGWTSDADINVIEKICNSVTSSSELQEIRHQIEPQLTSKVSDIGHRTRIRIALRKKIVK